MLLSIVRNGRISARNGSLRDEISSITQIKPVHVEDSKTASVAARMSWVADRETTRTEDIAYCMMGLFDVNMPLLYGEGEKAFKRLPYEIQKQTDDESLFAWKDENLYQSGMFARSPVAFRESGNSEPLGPKSESDLPWTVTNRGLSINAKFDQRVGGRVNLQDLVGLRLSCGIESDSHLCVPRQYVHILLSRTIGGEFVRHSPHDLSFEFYELDLGAEESGREFIYVRDFWLDSKTLDNWQMNHANLERVPSQAHGASKIKLLCRGHTDTNDNGVREWSIKRDRRSDFPLNFEFPSVIDCLLFTFQTGKNGSDIVHRSSCSETTEWKTCLR